MIVGIRFFRVRFLLIGRRMIDRIVACWNSSIRLFNETSLRDGNSPRLASAAERWILYTKKDE